MTPIKTIIRNKTAVAKAVNYIGKTPVWLPANGEAVVDFEIWSVADDSQKTAIKTLVQLGNIELDIMVLGTDGEYTVASFDPTGGATAKKEPVYMQAPANAGGVKKMVNEKDHIVKVGGEDTKKILEDMGAKAIGFEDEEIIPPREIKNGEAEPAKEQEAPAQEAPQEPVEEKPAAADNGTAGDKKPAKKGSKQKA